MPSCRTNARRRRGGVPAGGPPPLIRFRPIPRPGVPARAGPRAHAHFTARPAGGRRHGAAAPPAPPAPRQIPDEHDRLRPGHEDLRTEGEELQNRLEAREDRVDALEEQLARRSQIEEKVDVLAKRVEESQLTYAEKRQRMIDRASLAERLRWRVTGVPVDEYDDE